MKREKDKVNSIQTYLQKKYSVLRKGSELSLLISARVYSNPMV